MMILNDDPRVDLTYLKITYFSILNDLFTSSNILIRPDLAQRSDLSYQQAQRVTHLFLSVPISPIVSWKLFVFLSMTARISLKCSCIYLESLFICPHFHMQMFCTHDFYRNELIHTWHIFMLHVNYETLIHFFTFPLYHFP